MAATLNNPIPAFSISASPAVINAAAVANAGFTFAGATTNTTYTYTISSSNGGTPVTNSGSVTSATQSVSGINLAALNDGTLTISVTLNDQSGDTRTEQTTATLQRTLPSGYTISGVPAGINAAAATSVGFTINSPAGRRQRQLYLYDQQQQWRHARHEDRHHHFRVAADHRRERFQVA